MKKLISLVAMLSATTTFAASSEGMKSEDMFAPKSGGHEIYTALSIPTGKVETAGVSVNFTGMALNLGYSYGFSDMVALDLNQEYQTLDVTTTPATSSTKTSGLGDTTLGVKGLLNGSSHFLYYGANYKLGLLNTNKTTVAANGDSEASPVNARPSLNLNFGGGANLGMFDLGGIFEYSLFQDGDAKSETAGVTTTTKHKSGSGTRWKLFGQLNMGWKLGLSYQESVVDSYDSEVASVVTNVAKDEQKRLALYGIFPVSNMDILVSFAKPEPKDTTGQTWSYYEITAALRASF